MKDSRGLIPRVAAFLLFAVPGLVEGQGTSPFEYSDEIWVIQGVQVPPVSDTFLTMQVNPYPFRELGFVMKYQTPLTRRVNLDLYVYPVPDSLAEESVEVAISTEFEKAVTELKEYTASNREGMQVTVDTEAPITVSSPDGFTRSGWLAEGRFLRGNREDPTLLYVFSWDDLFVKVRATYHPEEVETLKPHLDAWLWKTFQRIRRDTEGGIR